MQICPGTQFMSFLVSRYKTKTICIYFQEFLKEGT
jgi:hypothetical protein